MVKKNFKDKLDGKYGAWEQTLAEMELRKCKQHLEEKHYEIIDKVAYDKTTGLALVDEDVEMLLYLGQSVDMDKSQRVLEKQLKRFL